MLKEQLFRHKRALHATENVGVSVMKGTNPAIMAQDGSGNHKRKAKWGQMWEVQEAMSSAVEQAVHRRSSVNRPGNRTHTTRVTQCQVGNENPDAHQANKAQQTRAGRSS